MKAKKYYVEFNSIVYDVKLIDFEKNKIKVYDPKLGRNRFLNEEEVDDGYYLENTGLFDQNGKEIWQEDYLVLNHIEQQEIIPTDSIDVIDFMEASSNLPIRETFCIVQVNKENENFYLRFIEDGNGYFTEPLYNYITNIDQCCQLLNIGGCEDWQKFKEIDKIHEDQGDLEH
jgi:hypothetical protein